MRNFKDTFSFYHQGKVNICKASSFLLRYITDDDESLLEEISNWSPYNDKDFEN